MKAESADIDLFKQSLIEIASLGKRERWLLKSEDLEPVAKEEVLGIGGFGVVRKYMFRGSPVAVKTPRVRSTSAADFARALRSLLNELRVLRQVRHPNIVLFHGMVMYSEASDATILALVFELIQGIPLNTYLSSHVSEVVRHKLMLGACRALRYLHANDPLICHGDIKDVNILVESWSAGPRARLLDFGLAHVFAAQSQLGGTQRWMAPEITLGSVNSLTPSADVYSFALVAYMAATSQKPFFRLDPQDIAGITRDGGSLALDWWVSSTPLANHMRVLCDKAVATSAEERPSIVEFHAQILAWNPADTNDTAAHEECGKTEQSSFGGFLHTEQQNLEVGSLAVWFDACSSSYAAVAVSPALQKASRIRTGCYLKHWVKDVEVFSKLTVHVQHMVNEFAHARAVTASDPIELTMERPGDPFTQVAGEWVLKVQAWIPEGSKLMSDANLSSNSGVLVQAMLLGSTISTI